MAEPSSKSLNSLLNRKSGINSHGFDTIHVVGAQNASEAANNISQYKLNYDPNPIVIRKTDPRGPVEYKQQVFVRFLQPPPPKEPGPLIIKEKRPPQQEPLPPLIVRQRAPRPKTPPALILREMPPNQYTHENGPRYVDVTAERNRQNGYWDNQHPQNYRNSHNRAFNSSSNGQNNADIIRQVLKNSYGSDGRNSGKWITEVVRN